MRIVHLVAGAGGMYCGSCLHGNTLAAALRAEGQDVVLVPLYTPLRTDEPSISIERVAYGGINVYLQQQSAIFRRLPRLLDRLLDHPRLLRWTTGRRMATRAEQLGSLTVSMLRGEQGKQHRELDKLVAWLKEEMRPELIHLNNVMLVGMARRLGEHLGVPVVCTLSGEDIFLEKIPEPHYSEARAALRERCRDLAALVALNGYYADFMSDYLSVPREQIRVIRPGLNLQGHAALGEVSRAPSPRSTITIGYLSRICPDKGLHLLVEALRLLAEEPHVVPIRLKAAGYLDEAARPYLDEIQKRAAQWGLADRFEYVGQPDRAEKIALLSSLDVMSVPTVYRESKGLPVLEAWANAAPVVLPDHGTFPELIADTGGGLLCEPNNPPALAAALRRMIEDSELAAECGRRGQEAVHDRYHAQRMARETAALYQEILARQ